MWNGKQKLRKKTQLIQDDMIFFSYFPFFSLHVARPNTIRNRFAKKGNKIDVILICPAPGEDVNGGAKLTTSSPLTTSSLGSGEMFSVQSGSSGLEIYSGTVCRRHHHFLTRYTIAAFAVLMMQYDDQCEITY